MPPLMPIASTKRALELGATFIESELVRMREQPVANDAAFMKGVELASASARLRALAESEPRS